MIDFNQRKEVSAIWDSNIFNKIKSDKKKVGYLSIGKDCLFFKNRDLRFLRIRIKTQPKVCLQKACLVEINEQNTTDIKLPIVSSSTVQWWLNAYRVF